MIKFRVNGRPVETAPSGQRLLDFLRLDLGLTGTKEGCGEGECGACSVLVGSNVVCSCLVPLCQADGEDITTIEGLAGSPLVQAFSDAGAAQCGACTPGMICAAEALLRGRSTIGPDDARTAIAGNLCRCTGYTKILDAVLAAASAR